jgi:Flp pilus assembly protein TadG
MRTISSSPALPTLRRGLIGGRDGTAALEFALIFPVLLTLFLGSFEVTNLYMANLKLTAATEAAADLAAQTRAQTPNLAPADIDSFNVAAGMVMTPYPRTALKLAFASVTYDASNNPLVLWHHEENSATAITTGSLNSVLLKTLGSGTDSVIMVRAQYVYTSPIAFVLGQTYTFSDTAYNRPRYVPKLTCTTC